MCIIIYSPNGKIPRKHLQRSLQANPDGWGFMHSRGGKLIIRRGMTVRSFWTAWKEENIDGSVVFHARIGTQGSLSEKNCHPFVLPKHNLAVAHNGIIKQHCVDDCPVSDTQLFVWEVLDKLPRGFLSEEAIGTLLEDYIGWSKLAFMDVHGRVKILNEHLGYWRNGRWYSNKSYLPPAKKEKPVEVKNRLLTVGETRPFWEVPAGGYKNNNGGNFFVT